MSAEIEDAAPLGAGLLTIDEVARALRLSTGNVRALAKDKNNPLREVKVGRYVRLTRASYDAYLNWLAA